MALLGLCALAPSAGAAVSWEMQPSVWDFGAVDPAAGPSATKTFVVSNTGTETLSLYATGIGWFDLEPQPFHIERNECFEIPSLAPAGSCEIDVYFDPPAAGRKKGLIDVSAIALGAPVTVGATLFGGAGQLPEEVVVPPPLPSFPPSPPTVALKRRPPHKTKRTSATFWFSGSPTATGFLCGLDGARLRSCQSPLRYRRLASGPHTVRIVAVDSSGQRGAQRVYRWAVERPRPPASAH